MSRKFIYRRRFLQATAALSTSVLCPTAPASPTPSRVLVVVGPSNHPPGTHEVAATGRLIQSCLQNLSNLPDLRVDLVEAWPSQGERDAAKCVVFLGDLFPPCQFPNAEDNLVQLEEMMKRGCGLTCIHYATGLTAKDVKSDGSHPLITWLGGYFAHRSCRRHQSVARIFPKATIAPAAPRHPVWRGCQEFSLHDEPYFSNYFGADGNRPADNVTILATSMLPPEAPKPEPVAWGVERVDGGRGFGVVMPHFFRNWSLDDLRRFILNGIVWAAGIEVPSDGVQTAKPDLAAFRPASVEPQSAAKKKTID